MSKKVDEKKENVSDKLNKLQQILSEDKQLIAEPKRFQTYLVLAKAFESDLAANIMLTSFELDDKYSTFDPHTWTEFKSFEPVRRYIKAFTDELQYTEATRTIAQSGNRAADALKVASKIDESRDSDKNTDIIVFLIPQRKYKSME